MAERENNDTTVARYLLLAEVIIGLLCWLLSLWNDIVSFMLMLVLFVLLLANLVLGVKLITKKPKGYIVHAIALLLPAALIIICAILFFSVISGMGC